MVKLKDYLLLVDDSIAEVSLFRNLFEMKGFTGGVEYLHSGVDVLPFLRANSQYLPKLIILDLNLPGMHGFELLQILKSDKEFQDIPVFIFSGSDNPSDKEKALELGAESFLLKAPELDFLETQVQEFITFWVEMDRVR